MATRRHERHDEIARHVVNIGRAPVRRKGDQFVISIGSEEREVVAHLLGELDEMLASPAETETNGALNRLFPTVYEDDPDREAEYQRLMREELVASKRSAIEIVTEAFGSARRNQVSLDEGELVAVMQSINSIRLVLGTLVGIDELEELDDLDDAGETVNSAEYQLYCYLSWLLDWCVRAISGGDQPDDQLDEQPDG